MNNKILKLIYIGTILIVCLLLLFSFGDTIITGEKGTLFQAERIARSLVILFLAYVFIQLIVTSFIDKVNENRDRKLTTVVKSVVSILVYSVAMVVIITGVYKQTFFSISAFFLSSWAVVAVSIKDFAINCVNGVLLDFSSEFEVGDWVKLKDGTIGKIADMKLAGVNLLMEDDTVFHITSSSFNSGEVINLSKPRPDYMNTLEVTLDHALPIDRARRVLHSAAVASKAVYRNEVSVFAESVEPCGIHYVVAFRVKNRETLAETKHCIINSIVKYLHKFGYKICQITGDINVHLEPVDTIKFFSKKEEELTPKEALKMTGLIDYNNSEALEKCAKSMKKLTFKKGESIDPKKGLFVIAEGVVELMAKNGGNKIRLIDGEYFKTIALAKTDNVVVYKIDERVIKSFLLENL